MSRYIRPRASGARIFATLCLAEKGGDLLVREVDLLRSAVVATLIDRPLQVDAWIVLPDHMHFVWTLPEGDSGYAVRIGAIKARFTMALRRAGRLERRRAGFSPPPAPLPVVRSGRYAGLKPGLRVAKREAGVWQRRFWEHHIRDETDFAAHVRYCWGNPVKHGFVRHPADWPYSSLHRDIRKGLVAPEWAGETIDGGFGEHG